MSSGAARPVIFISYSHKDEPDHPRDGEVAWLSFVRTYLQPAIKHGIFDLFVDEHIPGGADLKPEIERKLRACDIFLLLISPNSVASDYIIDTEIAITRERQAKGENVVFYPLLLEPTPKVALEQFFDKKVRPKDAKPLSDHPRNERIRVMNEVADEIAEIAASIVSQKPPPPPRAPQPAFVHLGGLPETPYEHLVGRGRELKRLDEAWEDKTTNVLSLIAEGGAGKSALVNEWLKRMQAGNYRGAESVLGWSFYSQGTKERATSADQFLNWAMEKLGIALETTSATAKGDAIAEELMRRRVLLVLDGVEPLQHGPDGQTGQLKDEGLRTLLRRFASTPPAAAHGLIVLTSRLAVTNISGKKDGAAPVVDLEKLSDDAGAALLRDNGVWGTDKELKQASHDFGGHPLALGLLASFLKETQNGDIRRRDHIRAFLADKDNPRHDHAVRVMESYEKEWFTGQPTLLLVMCIVGLFDRPANDASLRALREEPLFYGRLQAVCDDDWNRAVVRLREARLLAPAEAWNAATLDAHPLVREWFGERFKQMDGFAWRSAHGRLYEHLRESTREGQLPTLEDLAPLYQAVVHGCNAGKYTAALSEIYLGRIQRTLPNGGSENYATRKLGAFGTNLAVLSKFFVTPYSEIVRELTKREQQKVLSQAENCLRAQGRFTEALAVVRARAEVQPQIFSEISTSAKLKGQRRLMLVSATKFEVLIGDLNAACGSALFGTKLAGNQNLEKIQKELARVYFLKGCQADAERIFVELERQWCERHASREPLNRPGGYGGYYFSDLLLSKREWAVARDRSKMSVRRSRSDKVLVDIGLDEQILGRAYLGLGLSDAAASKASIEIQTVVGQARENISHAVDNLRAAGTIAFIPSGLLVRAAFRRSVGDLAGAARDLDEVEEIAEPGPMKLFLCDLALERARLAFAMIEAFAPLNGMIDDSPPKPEVPSAAKRKELHDEAAKQLAIAADYIATCGYHRRDAELAELQAVLKGERRFSDLPPRV